MLGDKEKVNSIVRQLSEIESADLDACSVDELTQFQFWLARYQGAIFVKTVGRLAENNKSYTPSQKAR